MLHIILAILKIIGLVLLAILGIILLLVLLVLFLPVRYDGRLKKEDSPFTADARAGWLFHLVQADIHFRDKKAEIRLKIFGKVLKTFYVPKGSEVPEEKRKPGKPDGRKKAGKPDRPAEQKEAGKPDRPAERKEAADPDGSFRTEKSQEKESPAVSGEYGKTESSTAAPKSEKTKKKTADVSGRTKTKISSGLQRLSDRAAALTGKIIKAVQRGLELPSDIGDRIDGVYDRTDKKIRNFQKKYGPFVTEDAFGFYGRMLGYLIGFLRCCRFRRLEGYMLIGTGEPDRTAEVIGLVHVLLPQAKGDYDIQADFYDKAFMTDTSFSGHIRLNHAVMLAVRLFKDKEFRRLLAHIRHKDEKGGKGRRKSRRKKAA